MMRIAVKIVVLAAVVIGVGNMAGCNTVQGVGKDIKMGGQAIEKAAK